jgi:hypothetical protein
MTSSLGSSKSDFPSDLQTTPAVGLPRAISYQVMGSFWLPLPLRLGNHVTLHHSSYRAPLVFISLKPIATHDQF